MWSLTREEQIIVFVILGVFLIGLGIEMRGGIPRRFTPPALQEPLRVRMTGAVRKPGWYTLPEGSSLGEAVERAGGPLPWASLEEADLDSLLNDEEEIYVPEGVLDINRALPEELAELPGIGPVLARRISSIDALIEVPGENNFKTSPILLGSSLSFDFFPDIYLKSVFDI